MKKIILMSALLAVGCAQANVVYQWSAPYQGAEQLELVNNGDADVTINNIEFNTSATAASPYGTLANNATIAHAAMEGLPFNHYTVTYTDDKPFVLAAHQSANLTFSYSSVAEGAPFAVGTTVAGVKVNGNSVVLDGMCQGDACKNPTPGYRMIGYYTDWDQYARKYNATDIPVTKANTINYAFIDTDKQGNLILLDPNSDYKQLTTIGNLQAKYPYLQTFLSFGGWSKSYNFSDLAADPTARANFVKNAVAAMREVGFNGIDIDWEYPVVGTRVVGSGGAETPVAGKAEDAKNYALLLTELRAALDKAGQEDGKTYYISIAVGAGFDKIDALTKADATAWSQMAKAVNYLNLMTYDFHGAFDYNADNPATSVADFHAAMALDSELDPTAKDALLKTYNIESAVAEFEQVGFKPEQMVLGIPAYGRMENVTQLGDSYGLYQSLVQGIPAGEYDDWQSGPTGVFDYKCIVDHATCGGQGATLLANLQSISQTTRDALTKDAVMPFAYIDQAGHYQFISYDDNVSTATKTQWAKAHHFAGVMFWSFSGDLPADNDRSLVNAAYQQLK